MDQLKQIFEAKGDHGLYVFKHKYEDALLEAGKAELAKCSTGQYQLKIVEVQGIEIKVVKNPEQMKFVPNGHLIYIGAPTELKKPNPEFILDLTQGIREAEQLLLGFGPKTDDKSSAEYSTSYFSCQVDQIIHMFKVADELQKSANSTVFLDKLVDYGYGDLYKLYKEDVPNEEIVDLYLSYRDK